MESLRILSLGRNLIKKIENLDAVADTLEELWISYNQITSLVSFPWEGRSWQGACCDVSHSVNLLLEAVIIESRSGMELGTDAASLLQTGWQ